METMGYVGIGIGVFIVLTIIGAYIYLHVIMKSHSAICPNCDHFWKPQIFKVLFTVHFFESVLLKCPSCSKRGMKTIEEDVVIEKLLIELSEEVNDSEDIKNNPIAE